MKRASKGIPDFASVNALAQVSDTIIAAAAFGVFRSTDNGDSWVEANEGLDEFGLLVRSLAVKATWFSRGLSAAFTFRLIAGRPGERRAKVCPRNLWS